VAHNLFSLDGVLVSKKLLSIALECTFFLLWPVFPKPALYAQAVSNCKVM